MTKTTVLVFTSLLVPAVCFADGNDSGLRTNVTIGGAEALSTKALGLGTSESVFVGYGSMHGRLGIDYGVELENQTYGDGWLVLGANRIDTYSARPTVRIEYFGDKWLPHASVGVGYTYWTGTGTIDGMSASATDNMLAIAGSVGLDYRITNRVALGAYVRYEPNFEPALNQFVDVGIALASR